MTNKNSRPMDELFHALEELGFDTNMRGILTARSKGLLTANEYDRLKEHMHAVVGVPRDWYKIYVWNAPI